jgi:antirestriction protein ArdC
MDTQFLTTSADLKAKITKHIQELAQATDEARVSEEMLRYLNTYAKFYQYSAFNVWLILLAKPDASIVAGFKKWQSMGRYVRKGEHGIPILAPIFMKVTNDKGEEEQRLASFKTVFVFDVSQTVGEPLPEPPDWKSPEKNAELQSSLLRFADSKGIVVQIKPIGRDIQGVSLGGKIVVDPEAGFKTYVHEVSHEMLHHIENAPIDRTTREVEAESVAYSVAKHFGLDGLPSPNYNALHGATAEIIMECLERIRNTAAEIIQALEADNRNPMNVVA